ncbi:phage GP46 family protein [Pseudomonas sp. GV071]|uniref:phage GP46 family protein n=1 Tax=Pseudomonas sp. GV071 TaxID=2135754 RepID=UPI000D3C5D4A|nr:phage GP46 family protein [Pseudomonas sp. GV071]PTQ68135.1 phage gp46-like protein [Pseudomonas sp. GV071]
MDAGIETTTGDLSGERIRSLANAVYLRLKTPLGSYWADVSMGSRLHELARAKDLARIGKLATQYAEQALQPLLDDRRATSVQVTAQQPHDGWLLLVVEVVDAGGSPQVFKHLVQVI